jgi:heptosyltransferase-2
MHVAAAFNVPTVTIFGPTRYKETNQWMNEKGYIVRKEMECSPCMKRVCPLGHHECMKTITADDVLQKLKLEGIIEYE